jgi:hypothetical protein
MTTCASAGIAGAKTNKKAADNNKNKPLYSKQIFPVKKLFWYKPFSISNAIAASSVAKFWIYNYRVGFDKKNAVIIPPIKIPPTKKRFHISFFQSYLKNEIFIGMQAGAYMTQ